MSGLSRPSTVSDVIAEYVLNCRYEALPTNIKECARKTLLNSVSTAIGAHGLPDVDRALAYAREEGASGPCTTLVTGEKRPLATGIFVNGVMYNTLGQEETHLQSGTHPAETTVPVILGLGEHVHASGVEVLEALVAGVEVTTAVAHMKLTPGVKYDLCEAPAVFGTIGAASAAARLMKLDAHTTAEAVCLAANLAAGLSECIKVGTAEYHFSVAAAGMHGYLAAALARTGAHAAPSSFEGKGGFYHLFAGVPTDKLASYDVAGDVQERLASAWSIDELIFKPYPINYFNSVFVDGARHLARDQGIQANEIDEVVIEVGTLAGFSGAMIRPPFLQRESVLGSTGFLVACMLARGHVTLEDTLDVSAPDIMAIFDKTRILMTDQLVSCRIAVRTASGTSRFDGEVEGRDYRLSEDELGAIASSILPDVLGAERGSELVKSLRMVEGLADISTLIAQTVRS